MKNLLYLMPLFAIGCIGAELAPVVVEPKAPAFTVPEGSAAVEVSAHCDCGLDRAEVAAEIQAVTNRVAKLEAFHAAAHAEPKLTQPQPAQKAPVQAKSDVGMCGPSGCSVGPARRAVGKGLFFRRR